MKKCNTLEEARTEIDKIDQDIVTMIGKRNDYIKQIATFKKSIDEVKEDSRIDDIISKVRTRAIELDLSPNLINELYLKMIEQMVETEMGEIKNARRF